MSDEFWKGFFTFATPVVIAVLQIINLLVSRSNSKKIKEVHTLANNNLQVANSALAAATAENANLRVDAAQKSGEKIALASETKETLRQSFEGKNK